MRKWVENNQVKTMHFNFFTPLLTPPLKSEIYFWHFTTIHNSCMWPNSLIHQFVKHTYCLLYMTCWSKKKCCAGFSQLFSWFCLWRVECLLSCWGHIDQLNVVGFSKGICPFPTISLKCAMELWNSIRHACISLYIFTCKEKKPSNWNIDNLPAIAKERNYSSICITTVSHLNQGVIYFQQPNIRITLE